MVDMGSCWVCLGFLDREENEKQTRPQGLGRVVTKGSDGKLKAEVPLLEKN